MTEGPRSRYLLLGKKQEVGEIGAIEGVVGVVMGGNRAGVAGLGTCVSKKMIGYVCAQRNCARGTKRNNMRGCVCLSNSRYLFVSAPLKDCGFRGGGD